MAGENNRRDAEFEAILARLNPEQRDAVETLHGPVRVVSGAGTGKTTTLTLRIVNLMVKGVARAEDILAVTFTNKAAREMRERIHKLIGDGAFRLTLGTFHATSMAILRRHATQVGLKNERFLVADTDDQLRLVEFAMDTLGFEDPDRSENGKPSKEFRAHAKKLHGFIQAWKEGGRRLEEVMKMDRLPLELGLARDVWPVYQKLLLERNTCDFADLLAYVVELFETDKDFAERWSRRWKYVCVDEFQDTNELQLRWLRHVCANTDNIYIIGDPDQAIYAWRNAKAEVMSAVLEDWPGMKTIVLKTNYRSSQPILDAANRVVDENPRELPKQLESGRVGEAPRLLEFQSARAEASYVADTIRELVAKGQDQNEIAVLVRSAFIMRVIEQELVRQKLPYRVSGGFRFFERQEIRDALAYLRLLVDRNDALALERIVNRPTRGIGEKTAARIVEHMRSGLDAVAALRTTATEKGVQTKAKTGMTSLASHLEIGLREMEDDVPHHVVLEGLVRRMGFLEWLLKTEDDKGAEKVENVKEMFVAASEHASAEDFLVAATLNEETAEEASAGGVALSTIHAAKGQEFDVVFSPALEYGVLPNGRALQEPNGIEEERRICHVAWTRARKSLTISYCLNRNGTPAMPSPFLDASGLGVEIVETQDDRPRPAFQRSGRDFFRRVNV